MIGYELFAHHKKNYTIFCNSLNQYFQIFNFHLNFHFLIPKLIILFGYSLTISLSLFNIDQGLFSNCLIHIAIILSF